ncbi:MAG: hypothetical protein KF836_01250 [Fimbriimonadaceae bacterium]|nr:hypothetical protein [Fimbriimonadaceae bacterium]
MKRAIMALLVALFSTMSMACLWDRDTLAQEMKGLPEIADVIAGRFDRFPPEYYEDRLKRIEAGLGETMLKLGDYDDAAVACDRLGRADEAIEWMARKQEAMAQMKLEERELSEHNYRTHANLGTFLVHRAFASKEPDMEGLKKGLAELEKAIEINPDAHFGRENVQIALIKDIIWEKGDHSEERPTVDIPSKKLQEGLIGLMVLGKAWESPKVWAWLEGSLGEEDAHAAHLIRRRMAEFKATDVAIAKDLPKPLTPPTRTLKDEEETDAYYEELRENGKKWSEERNKYISEQIKAGNHPDLNAKFWDDFKEVAKVEPKSAADAGTLNSIGLISALGIGTAIGLGLILAQRQFNRNNAV